MKLRKFGYLLLLPLIIFSLFPAQKGIAQGMMDPVSFTVTTAPDEVAAGESFEIVIEARIEGKWHLYSVNNDPDAGPYPTKFSSPAEILAIEGKVKESEPITGYDPNFDAELGWHAREATFTIPLSFSEAVQAGEVINLEVFYQVCDDKSCLPPKSKTITVPVAVAMSGGGATAASEAVNTPPADEPAATNANNSDKKKGAVANDVNEKSEMTGAEPAGTAQSEPGQADNKQESATIAAPATASSGAGGLFSFLWIAITAGFAALITPCVYPMIPLTVSYFSKNSEGNQPTAVSSAFTFGVAIVAVFTLLGILLSLLIGVSGANQFAANPWVNLFIGGILLVFAVSLLGAFELRLPHRLTNWLNKKSNERTGMVGILFMALTISAVSFACTAPFVSGVLAATAGGEWFYPILGMVGFSAAFASPFVLFALFPGWLESLPKSGSWMNIVKVLLGFIELAAAVKFFSNVDLVWNWGLISRPFAIAIWIAIFLLAGLYLLGTYSLKHETKPDHIGTGRLMLSIPFLLFSFYLIPGLLGASVGIWDAWLPPKQATDVSVVYSIAAMGGGGSGESVTEFEAWSEDYDQSVTAAKASGQPVFIDFTGYTCTNCRAMEANVFPRAGVQQQFEQMELVRLYTDDGTVGPKHQKFQFELTGTIALPTYAIVDPHSGKVINQLSGMTDKDTFQQFLETGLQTYQQKTGSEYLGQVQKD